MIEIRKIQQVGRSTLAVAIPKKWATDIEMKPGAQVSIERDVDGSFRIRTDTYAKRRMSKCVINADRCDSFGMLERSITGIYLTGREVIEIRSNEELNPNYLKQIRNAVQRLTGLGIIEQTSKSVIIHDFLDPAKFPFENLIKHMFQTLSFMQQSLIKTLDKCDVNSVKELKYLEEEFDRLYRLTVRQLLLVLIDGTVGDKIGISSLSNAARGYVIAKCLEDVADHYENISVTSLDALKKGLKSNDENLVIIINFSNKLHIMMNNVFTTLISSDTFKANNLINEIETLLEDMSSFAMKLLEKDKKVDFVVNINSILWNLREVARQCRSILETVINQCVAESENFGV